MPKFRVYLVGRQTVFATIEITADTRDEARELAREYAEDGDATWTDDYEKMVEDIEVVNVAELAEGA